MFVYIIVLMILLAPGIALSALVYFVAGYLPGLLIGMPIFIWNVAVSLGIFAACRNLLSTAEFNS